MKWLTANTIKAMSGLVSIIGNITEPTMLWYLLTSFLLAVFLLAMSSTECFIGTSEVLTFYNPKHLRALIR